MPPQILTKADGPVAEIILNNPGRHNAMTGAMWRGLANTCRTLGDDSAVRVIILHGGPDGHFSAGADMSEFEQTFATETGARQAAIDISNASRAIAACPKPVLAALEGSCMGGALALAGAADLRIGGEGARFALTPAKLGVAYPVEDLRRLSDIVGPAVLRDLYLTARTFGLDEADRLGLISRSTPKGGALEAAHQIAQDMTALSGWSLASGKQMLAKIASGTRLESPDMLDLFIEGFLGEDFEEGYRAFLDKRPPDFS